MKYVIFPKQIDTKKVTVLLKKKCFQRRKRAKHVVHRKIAIGPFIVTL